MASKSSGAKKVKNNLPPDVSAIVFELEKFFEARDEDDRRWCDAKRGVYAFYDFDNEPIYVGQTKEQLRTRIRRHMTNQRTDAVAMRVLDPLEVAEVAVWPFWQLEDMNLRIREQREEVDKILNAAEFTLYQRVISESSIGRVLNEKIPTSFGIIELPTSFRQRIVPDSLMDRLGHPDERIARRALKISELAGVIRQRDVSVGLRNTLVTQAARLHHLSQSRFAEVLGDTPPEVAQSELFGTEDIEEDELPDA